MLSCDACDIFSHLPRISETIYFCFRAGNWWGFKLKPISVVSILGVVIARSAYYVPLAHQEPASVRAPSVRRRPCAVRRPPASGHISKCPKNGPLETDLRTK